MYPSSYYKLLAGMTEFLEGLTTKEPLDRIFCILDGGETIEIRDTLLKQCRESPAWRELEARFTQEWGTFNVFYKAGNDAQGIYDLPSL
jgi:hypothetical protein